MKRYRCYICSWRDPLNGFYEYLTISEMASYRLAGWIVSERSS